MHAKPRHASEAHVVLLAQYLPLHFVSTMHCLAQKVRKLTIVLSEQMDMSRDWQPQFDGLNVIIQRSLRFPIRHRHPSGFEDQGKLIIPCSTVGDLTSLQPDVVIAVEVGARTIQAYLLQCLGARYKLIVQVRESEITARSRGEIRRWLRRTFLPRVDHVFVNGASGRRYVETCGVQTDRITVVPSGTDQTVFGHTSHPQRAAEELHLLYVGQLIPRKGLVPFVKALCQVAFQSQRGIRLRLAGRGPGEQELRQLVLPDNLSLEFLGSQPYQSLPAVYAQADALIMPSLADEWGLVVNEAMASGLPVVGSTGAQAVEELVVPGISGWIYPPHDEEAMREALRALVAASPAELDAMGHSARMHALRTSDEFAAHAMATGIDKVLLPQPRSRRARSTLTELQPGIPP